MDCLDLYNEADGTAVNKGVVNLIVGGIHYSLEYVELNRFPNSYFAHMMKDEWYPDKGASIVIDRDGEVFRCIYNFIYFGTLGSTKFESVRNLVSVRREADFYILPDLVAICDTRLIEKFKTLCQNDNIITRSMGSYHCMQSSVDAEHYVNLLDLKRPDAVSVMSTRFPDLHETINVLNSSAIADCAYHNCGDLTEQFRWYYFLGPLTRLFENSRWPLSGDRFGRHEIKVFGARVFEYKTGGYCTGRAYMSSSRSLGMIVYIFQSTYTGGVITCTAHGKSESIGSPGMCMAVQAGCTYTVGTVTSGTLIVVEVSVHRNRESPTKQSAASYKPTASGDGANSTLGANISRFVRARDKLKAMCKRTTSTLQHELTSMLQKRDLDAMLSRELGPLSLPVAHFNWLNSLQCKEAGMWLTVCKTKGFKLTNDEFQVAILHRCFGVQPSLLPNFKCKCGRGAGHVDARGHHLITGCSKDGVRQATHDSVTDLLYNILRMYGVYARKEVCPFKAVNPKSKKRLDIVVEEGQLGWEKRALLDVTVTNPVNAHTRNTRVNQNTAANAAHTEKLNKYSVQAAEANCVVQPVVFESTGRLHPNTITLLKRIAGVDGPNVDQDSKCLYRYWMRMISMTLQKGLARAFLKGRNRLMSNNYKTPRRLSQYNVNSLNDNYVMNHLSSDE